MSSRVRGASASTGQPDLRMAVSDSWRYGTEAITRSARTGKSSSALVDQESWTTGKECSRRVGTASRQYFVQAASESRQPSRSRTMLTLGCREMIFIRPLQLAVSEDGPGIEDRPAVLGSDLQQRRRRVHRKRPFRHHQHGRIVYRVAKDCIGALDTRFEQS